MFTGEDDVDAHALRRQGWTISAIALHLGHDRKTIRAYLTGGGVHVSRASTAKDPLGPFVGYLGQPLACRGSAWLCGAAPSAGASLRPGPLQVLLGRAEDRGATTTR